MNMYHMCCMCLHPCMYGMYLSVLHVCICMQYVVHACEYPVCMCCEYIYVILIYCVMRVRIFRKRCVCAMYANFTKFINCTNNLILLSLFVQITEVY